MSLFFRRDFFGPKLMTGIKLRMSLFFRDSFTFEMDRADPIRSRPGVGGWAGVKGKILFMSTSGMVGKHRKNVNRHDGVAPQRDAGRGSGPRQKPLREREVSDRETTPALYTMGGAVGSNCRNACSVFSRAPSGTGTRVQRLENQRLFHRSANARPSSVHATRSSAMTVPGFLRSSQVRTIATSQAAPATASAKPHHVTIASVPLRDRINPTLLATAATEGAAESN
jgi:hypothetical protein